LFEHRVLRGISNQPPDYVKVRRRLPRWRVVWVTWRDPYLVRFGNNLSENADSLSGVTGKV
jgi:hypothetical protein